MPGPLAGQPTRTDWLLVCEMADAQVAGRDADAAALCGAAGVPTPYLFEGAGGVPSVLLVALPEVLILSVTGTNQAQQMAANVVAVGLAAVPGVPGRVHQFWGAVGQNIARSVRDTVSTFEQGRRVVCVGHSLGGAVAQVLAALLLAAGYPNVGCYSAGAPRAGDPAFAEFVGPVTWRLEAAGDPVVSLPPVPGDLPAWVPDLGWPRPADVYVHAGAPWTVGLAGDLTPGSTPLPSVQAAAALLQDGSAAHLASEYVRRLAFGWGPDYRTPGAGGYPDAALLAVPLDNAGVYFPRDVSRDPGPPAGNTRRNPAMSGFFNSKFRFADGNGEVWSERIYYPGASDMSTAYQRATVYIQARAALFGPGVRIIRHTVSSDDLFRDWWPGFIPSPQIGQNGVTFWSAGTNTGRCEFAWTTMLVDLTTNDGLYHGRMFLSGLPSDLAKSGLSAPAAVESFGAWAAEWGKYSRLLVPKPGTAQDQFAFKAGSKEDAIAPRMRVTGANWAAGVQTVTTAPMVAGGPAVNFVPGQSVVISRTRGSGVQINGTVVVTAGGAGTFSFPQPTPPGFTWVKGGWVRPKVPGLILPSFITPLYFTSRKRANPVVGKKGRRPKAGAFQYPAFRPPSV